MSIETEYGLWDGKNRDINTNIFKIFNSKYYSLLSPEYDHIKSAGCSYPMVLRRNYLFNGTQLYTDMGHIEAALPECSNARDVVLYDEAASLILKKLSIKNGVSIFKNNTDYYGNSFGCHTNFFLNKIMDKYEDSIYYVMGRILPFLVTQQIFTGAGHISNGKYLISQRSGFIESTCSSITISKRAIFNTRMEAHAGNGFRVHLILSDANMSQYSTYLKMGTTSIILDMIEKGFLQDSFKILNPVSDMKRINNCGIKTKIEGEFHPYSNLNFLTPIDIQRYYLESSKIFFSSFPDMLDPISRDIMEKWEFVLSSLDEDYMSLDRHLDWVIKKSIIDKFINYSGKNLYSEGVMKINLNYHLLRRDGIFYSLYKKMGLEEIVSEDEIKNAIYNPPKDTRAFGRTNLIKELKKKSHKINFDWSEIVYNLNGLRFVVNLDDPYNTYEDLLIK